MFSDSFLRGNGLLLSDVRPLASILEACQDGARVEVLTADGNLISGVARHVVSPDSIGFERTPRPDARLRVTSTFEHFLPLSEIEHFRRMDKHGSPLMAGGW